MASARYGARLLIAVWLAASVALMAARFRSPSESFDDFAYLAVAAGAVIVAWTGAALLRDRDRVVASLLAAAVTSSSLGDVASLTIQWRSGVEPDASVADAFWLATYPLLGAALLVLLHRTAVHQRRDVDGLIDVASVIVAGMMVIWALAVSATLTDTSLPILPRVVWGLYPVLDLAILALVLRLLLRDRTAAALVLAIATGVWLFADFSYLVTADPSSYSAALDAAWLGALMLVALAVAIGPRTPLRRGQPQRQPADDETGLGRISLALLPLLVPALIELQWLVRGEDVTTTVTVPGTVLLVALAFLRVARLASSARRSRSALASQGRYAAALAANSSDAVAVVDSDLWMIKESPKLPALVGRPADEVCHSNLLSLVAPADHERTRHALRRCLPSDDEAIQLEIRLRDDHGPWMAVRMRNLLNDPDVGGIVVTLHDISARKHAEEQLNRQAFHDPLTGLANRALFRDRLNHALERRPGAGGPPTVLFLDLDGFKAINDRLGHDLGDELLRRVAAKLVSAVDRGQTVGRLGGDEFTVLIEQADRPMADAISTAERLLQALREPVQLGEHSVTITASLGIAVGHRFSSTDLLRDADVAMYRSKATGKDKWTIYRPGMRTAARERLELVTAMQLALERNEFHLAYQPLLDLQSHCVIGVEALLRWQHPTRGALLPEHFIPLAEETGLIVPIGRWVLREAITTASGWQQHAGLGQALCMAVNLSARQLADTDLVGYVADLLDTSRISADNLVLEVTETALVEDTVAASARLHRLHTLGVQLAIDDFGTGYSSLSYLRHFPVDILKIDRSFVDSIPEHGRFPPVMRGLLELARTLQIRTLAEGVEHDFQRERLRAEKCDLAQGYLLASPMPAAQASQFISRAAAGEHAALPASRAGPG